MSRYSVFQPSPPWTNQPVRLYHGTTTAHAFAITTSGVRVSASRTRIDFGQGFYTTTVQRQAQAWAWQLTDGRAAKPAVVYADVDRDVLAGLDCLWFVRGDFQAEDFWSFVVHCRTYGTDHARLTAGKSRYDVVIGPVTAMWKQRTPMPDSDQISFHTSAAEAVLNTVSWRILR
jgi:hypothetical protein